MNLVELIRNQLDDNTVEELQHEIGAESKEQTEAAANAVISTLVAGLNKNVERPGGAEELVSAIDRDHDGSLLEDLAGNLFGKRKVANPRATNGLGILDHILGGRQEQVNDGLGRATGLQKNQILNLMIRLAPMVLAMLGRMRNRQGLGTEQISDLLRGTVQAQRTQRKETGLLERLLDSNDDGGVMDDLANLGRNVFTRRG